MHCRCFYHAMGTKELGKEGLDVVITQDMPVSGIANSWDETKEIFREYGIPADSNKALKEHFQGEQLDSIISFLNKTIGSSDATCIEGG